MTPFRVPLRSRQAWPIFLSFTAAVSALSLGSAHAASDVPLKRYSIRADRPDTGSNIRRELMAGVMVPIDSTYAQLDADERARWNQQYESLGPRDEPPYPRDGLQSVLRPVVDLQNRVTVVGEVSLVAEVDASGAVQRVQVLKSPNAQFAQAAAAVLILTPFKPARCDDKPCSMGFPLRMQMLAPESTAPLLKYRGFDTR